MSSEFSFWNGQPVNAPIFPQMGDAMNAGHVGGQWSSSAAAPASSGPRTQPMPQGMGDFQPMRCPPMAPNFFGQPQGMGSGFGDDQGPCEPCIDNGEAFCAYNDLDMNCGGRIKGDFW
ncbi:uncharacterized protein LOC6725656 [Drosophila simulans]|uniref:GD17008 n=1 Tax=Drosophila simulans TaxID=7240 RepID=B4R2S2_DROSI|nr:uncharacterized protein LOC6725656 [Drosophila simulans]EDX17621.1 GD17008 [Drosophila simulans]KMZ09215.1 uncharacterized protein Dsimw501_GD17008 [Drosophila simulans]